MQPRKLALLCVVVGALCLPAPLYLSVAAEAVAPPPKASQIYVAESLDPGNASDRERIVDRHGTAVAISIHQVSDAYSHGEYRAPNATHRVLETAMANGSATTDDAAVRADLRAIARNDSFVHDAYDDRDQYYRLEVTANGSEVTTSRVSTARVANATIERSAYRYGSLTAGERRTVDRILANSTGESWGYRPRVNDPFVDALPALVVMDGTLYSLHANGHVDDLGPGFTWFVYGLGVAGVGVLLLLAGGGIYGVDRWRGGTAEEIA